MNTTSQMKKVEWDVMDIEGSTEGYRWYYDDNGIAYFMNINHVYIIGDDDEWVRADLE